MKVELVTVTGPKEVRAFRIGELAVHPTIGAPFSTGFTITHIGSGRAVKSDLCCKRAAIDLATKLRAFNWAFSLPKKSISVFPKRVLESMREAAKLVESWECPAHSSAPRTSRRTKH
jgi:hypothetical protein